MLIGSTISGADHALSFNGSGSTHNNSGALGADLFAASVDFTGANNHSGTVDFNGRNWLVAGNYNAASGGAMAVAGTGGGALVLRGTTAQTFTPKTGLTFPSLTQNGSGGTTLSTNDLTLTGNLTITQGTLNANGRAISVAGNWSNSGTFTPGAGTVTFTGTQTQSVTGNATLNHVTAYAFTPTSLSGCNLWYDAADTATVTASGGNVTAWNDKSGNGNHLGSINFPRYNDTQLNGLPVVSCPYTTLYGGQGNSLWRNGSVSLAMTETTLFLVHRRPSATTAGGFFQLHSSNSSVSTLKLTQMDDVGYTFRVDRNVGGDGLATQNAVPAVDTWGLTTVLRQAGLGTMRGSTASTLGQHTDVYNDTNAMAPDRITLSNTDGLDSRAGNDFAEIIMFNRALTQAERIQVENYLGDKWGVGTATTRAMQFAAGSTQTVNGTLTLQGSAGNLLALRSSSSGSTWSLTPNGTRTCSYVDVKDGINAVAPAINPASSTDSGNTTRWFSLPGRYWVASSAGNWSSTANWSTTSNGAGGASVPTSANLAVFDGGSASSKSGTCTIDVAAAAGELSMTTGYLGTVVFGANDLTVTGDADLRSGGAFTSTTGRLVLSGTGVQSLTPPATGSIPTLAKTGSGTATVVTNPLQVLGGITISAGTLASGNKNITLTGDWANSVGAGGFSAGTATVTFAGSGTQAISGNTTFNALTGTVLTPTQLQGCRVWLDADDAATFTLGTDYVGQTRWVGQWQDKSGNRFDCYKYSGGQNSSPLRGYTTLNGRSVVSISPTYNNDSNWRPLYSSGWDNNNGGMIFSQASADNTIIVVHRKTSTSYVTVVFGMYSSNESSNVNGMSMWDSTGGNTYTVRRWVGSDNLDLATASPANNVWGITTIQRNQGAAALRVNGTQITTDTYDDLSVMNPTTYEIGGNSGTDAQAPNDVAELVLYNRALSANEMAQVEGYLGAKWSLGTVANRTLQFAAGSTQTVGGALSLNGSAGSLLYLRSSSTGSTWSLTPTSTRSCSYVDVKDGINTVSPAILPANSTDSGNTTLWFPVTDPGTRYWVATGTTNWSSTSGWAYTSGGASGVAVPISTNTVYFDGNVGVGDCTVTAGATAASVTITSGYGGTITGSNALTLTGGISQAGGTLTLAAANTIGAGTTLTGGTLNLNHATALGAGTNTLTISGGTLNNSSGGSITLSNNNPQSWGGSFPFTGSNALNMGTGAVTMTASPTITVNGSTLTEGGVISGAFNLTKAGTGTLVLTGANTYTGTTTLNAGVVNAGIAEVANTSGPFGARLANAAGSIVLGGATLQYSAANQNDYSGRFSTAAGQSYKVDTNGQNVTWGTALTSSTGTLTKSGTGTLTLTGANTYGGITTLSAGTVNLGIAEVVNTTGPFGKQLANAAGTIVLGGGTLQYSASNTNDYSGRFSTAASQAYNVDTNGQNVTWGTALTSSGGTLTKTGTGTLTLGGANTYAGTTSVNAGQVTLTGSLGNTAVTVAGSATFAAGTVTVGSGTASLALNASSTYTMVDATSSRTCTVSGTTAISGATVNVELDSGGADKLAVSGAATVTGTNNVGVTCLGSSLSLAAYNVVTASSGLATGGTWQFTGGGTTQRVSVGSNTYTLTLSVSATAVTVTVTNPVNTWNGTTDTTWNTASNWSLNQVPGLNQDIQIGNGSGGSKLVPSLNVAGTCNSITFMTLASTLGGANTLTLGAGGITASVTGSSIACPVTLNANQTWALGANTLTVSGAIGGGSTTLAQTGAGTLILTGTNGYTGTTTVGGTLQLGTGTNGQDGSVAGDIIDGGAVAFNYFGAVTYAGVISSTGTVSKSGAGTVTLSGNSSYTGLTTISVGTVKLGIAGSASNGPLGTVGAGTVVSGTTAALDLNGITLANAEGLTLNGTGVSSGGALLNSNATGATYSGLVVLGSASTITSGTGNILLTNTGTISGAYALTLDGTTTGSSIASIIGIGVGTVTKNGTGTWTLSGTASNTYSGITTVNVGELDLNKTAGQNAIPGALVIGDGTGGANADIVKLLATNQIVDTCAVTLNSTGKLDLNSVSETIGSLVGSGNVALGTATLTYGDATASLTYSGVISGTGGSVTKQGAGTSVLTGANTYTGTTTLNAGVVNAGIAEVANTSGPFGARLANAAGSIVLGGATLQYSAANQNDYSGRFSTAAGQSYKVDTNGQNVTWGTALTSSTGTLTKSGTGTLTLSGTSTYSGQTLVSVGTLQVNGTVDSSTGGVSVSGAATLGCAGTITGVVTTANTATLSPGASAGARGTITLSAVSPILATATTTLAMDINGATYDQVSCTAASGSLALGNIALSLSTTTPSAASYPLITYASGAITGTFLSVSGVPAGYAITYTPTTVNLALKTRYWVGGTGSWNQIANWAVTSGTSGGYSVPTTTDAVFFDGSSGGGTATVDAAYSVASLTCTGYTGILAFGTNMVTVGGNATMTTSGSYTGSTGGLTMGASGTLVPPAAGTLPSLTVSAGTTTLSTNNLSLSNHLTISGGTLGANGLNLSVAGNWANAGTFTHGGNTVTLNGAAASTQVLSGSSTFNNLIATCTTARTLNFTAGTTQTVGGALTLTGATGQRLSLRSTVNGSTWNLDYTGARTISAVAVQDGTNLGAGPLNPSGSTDLGNCVNWFAPLAVALSTPVNCPVGDDIATYGRTLNPRPALIWYVPAYRDGVKLHFVVSVDGSPVADSAASQAGFDYYNGTTWTMAPAFPAAGVDEGSGTQLVRWHPQAALGVAAHTWTVLAVEAGGAHSSPAGATRRFLIASSAWTAGLAAGSQIRVGHVDELRLEVDYARNFRGLADLVWTDTPLVARQTQIRKVHIDELRSGLSAVTTISGESVTIGAATITARQTAIAASHLSELRTALEGQ